MKLRGIEFGNVFTASGTLNFFGQGWPYHLLYKRFFPFMFGFKNSTFISKTTTLNKREGNMSLKKSLQPKKFFPDCIKIYFMKGVMLNAVGLSGPGLKHLLAKGLWQKRIEPFVISVMCVGDSLEDKLVEAREIVRLLKLELPKFKAPICLQVNVSCPNTGHNTSSMTNDALKLLEVFNELSVPIDVKISITDATMSLVRDLEESGLCDCITCSNTVAWRKLQHMIDWDSLFRTTISPLAKYGGGGLSGKPLLSPVEDFSLNVNKRGFKIPIKVGGGILCKRDTERLIKANVAGFEIGSVAVLRPWRVQGIIKYLNKRFGEHNERNYNKAA